jgi:hypothetical protein
VNGCERSAERVAGEGACAVYRCSCGSVHLHIGATTVRLSPESFEQVARVAQEALLRFTARPSATH